MQLLGKCGRSLWQPTTPRPISFRFQAFVHPPSHDCTPVCVHLELLCIPTHFHCLHVTKCNQTFIPPFTCHSDPQDWMVSGFLYCSVEALCVFHPIQQVIKIIIADISPSPRDPTSIVFFVILIVWFCGYRMLSYCALLDNVFVWLCETF